MLGGDRVAAGVWRPTGAGARQRTRQLDARAPQADRRACRVCALVANSVALVRVVLLVIPVGLVGCSSGGPEPRSPREPVRTVGDGAPASDLPGSCVGHGSGGWKFSARVSADDGLILEDSSFGGRRLTGTVSVPYVEALWKDGSRDRTTRIELTPDRGNRRPGVPGATLSDFQCQPRGDGDIFVSATYKLDDFMYGGADSIGLAVTQQYRFRAAEQGDLCEVSGRLRCGRFWPSVSYRSELPEACSSAPGAAPTCKLFAGLRTIQRMEFRPDDAGNGAINVFKDGPTPGALLNAAAVATKGNGAMRYEAVDQAIRDGRRGAWDSIHQSPSSTTSSPGINPFIFTPGCAGCVHMHWAWAKAVNIAQGGRLNPAFLRPYDFTDGLPQLLPHSTQDADFGIVRLEDPRRFPEEFDPVDEGWRALVDPKNSAASKLPGHRLVIFWEMTSRGSTDAAWPVLSDNKHGGNGSLFFAAPRGDKSNFGETVYIDVRSAEATQPELVSEPTVMSERGLRLEDIRWHGWSEPIATADATAFLNLCRPSCAEANAVTGPARLRAFDLHEEAGHSIYGCMEVFIGPSRPASPQAAQVATADDLRARDAGEVGWASGLLEQNEHGFRDARNCPPRAPPNPGNARTQSPSSPPSPSLCASNPRLQLCNP